jgi:hypothetical protein
MRTGGQPLTPKMNGAPVQTGSTMSNVHLESRPKGHPLLWAFVGLLAAVLAGPICAFAANGYWDFQTSVVAMTNETL